MIIVQTALEVADNSGAKIVECIGVKGGTGFKVARLGDIVVVTVKSAISGGKAKKGQIFSGVVVRTKKEVKRKDGSTVKFDNNSVVLVNKNTLEPVGTRVFGPVAKELKKLGFSKIVSLASEVI